jgi:hypothetical protein
MPEEAAPDAASSFGQPTSYTLELAVGVSLTANR